MKRRTRGRMKWMNERKEERKKRSKYAYSKEYSCRT
jgi:hypothetical protein